MGLQTYFCKLLGRLHRNKHDANDEYGANPPKLALYKSKYSDLQFRCSEDAKRLLEGFVQNYEKSVRIEAARIAKQKGRAEITSEDFYEAVKKVRRL